MGQGSNNSTVPVILDCSDSILVLIRDCNQISGSFNYDVIMTSDQTRSVAIGYTNAPRLGRVNGEDLIPGRAPWLVRRGSSRLLDQFIRIAESAQTNHAVTIFANRWGLLQLCEHGLPCWHNSRTQCQAADSVESYKTFAVSLDAMLRIGLELNRRRCGADTDWQLANGGLSAPDFQPWSNEERHDFQSNLGTARLHFQILMRRLARVAGLTLRFYWNDRGWAIDFDCDRGSNLAALMVVQLMARLGGPSMKKCRNCPRWFQPAGRQVYCSACGIRAAWRDAAARHRARRL